MLDKKVDITRIIKECQETNGGILEKLRQIKMLADNTDVHHSKIMEDYQ